MPALNFTGTSGSTSFAYSDIEFAGAPVFFKPGFLALIQKLSKFKGPASVFWTGDPNPMISPIDQACIKLRVRTMATNGIDEIRDVALSGQREIVVSFRCETYLRSAEADEILNRVIAGLWLPTSADTLDSMSLALATVGQAQYMAYTSNEQEVNVAIVDIKFNAVSNIMGDPYGGYGYIQTVDGNDVPGDFSIPIPPAFIPPPPAMPPAAVLLLDASIPTSLLKSGVMVSDGGLIDTWGIASQGTPAADPFFDSYGVGAGPAVVFGGGAAGLMTNTTLTTSTITTGVPYTIICVFRCDGFESVANVYMVPSDTASPGPWLYSTTGFTIYLATSLGTQTANLFGGWGDTNVPMWTAQSADGSSGGMQLSLTGVSQSLSVAGTTGQNSWPTQVSLGFAPGFGNYLFGAIGLFAIYNRILTGLELSEVQAYIQSKWLMPPASATINRNCIAVGDSILGYTMPHSFFNRTVTNIGPRMGTANNFAVPGATLGQIQNQWVSGGGAAAIVSGKRNWACLEGGINDLNNAAPTDLPSATTAANNALAAWHSLVSTVVGNLNGVSGGPHLITVPTVTGTTISPWVTVATGLLNTSLRSQASAWGTSNVQVLLVDPGADPIMGDGTHALANYWADGVHPSFPGSERIAGILTKAILAAGF
jgi:lysophospholipase L1-like esterase